jgi:cytochrome c
MRRYLVLGTVLVSVSATGAFAQGDPAAGQRVFNQCRACHNIEAGQPNKVGPNLHGVVGRKLAAVDGFRYSANLKQLGEGGKVWDDETLRAYLANPKSVAPQGSMAFPGIRNEQQLNDVIAYVKQASGK